MGYIVNAASPYPESRHLCICGVNGLTKKSINYLLNVILRCGIVAVIVKISFENFYTSILFRGRYTFRA